jgi:hypothetical protein
MTASDVGAAVERLIACWNADDRDGYLDCLSERVRNETPVGAPVGRGHEPFETKWAQFAARRPRVEIQKLVVCGSECAVHLTSTSTVDGTTSTSHVIEVWAIDQNGKLDDVRVFTSAGTQG